LSRIRYLGSVTLCVTAGMEIRTTVNLFIANHLILLSNFARIA
jgi:hypothetical protein